MTTTNSLITQMLRFTFCVTLLACVSARNNSEIFITSLCTCPPGGASDECRHGSTGAALPSVEATRVHMFHQLSCHPGQSQCRLCHHVGNLGTTERGERRGCQGRRAVSV